MNYHVFIVDKKTFNYHLEYMFAGTGAGNKNVSFLTNCSVSIHGTTERNLVGMIADVSKIRKGDKIIFYLQASNGNPGMFYSVFVANSTAFFDENDNNNYLKDKMGKPLTFRIKIAPDVVYPIGVSEHDYLDSLAGLDHPCQMCWSLIYRKLKGNRGCTMITEHEYKRLVMKLKSANNNVHLCQSATSFSFDDNSYTIKELGPLPTYKGRTESIDIKSRLLFKANRNNAFECHLQAFIMQNFDKIPLKKFLIPYCEDPCWIGNEVSCGVGMQRIDVMLVQQKGDDVYARIIELKCGSPYTDILSQQLHWYINWVTEYFAPNYTSQSKTVHIIPCVIAKSSTNADFINKCKTFRHDYTNHNNVVIEQAEYIGFDICKNDICFSKIV